MKDIGDRILNALNEANCKGLVVDELSASLGIDVQTIIIALEKLITEKLILEKTDADEAKYFMKTALEGEAEQGSLGDLDGCPCFHCLKISRCGVRQPDSPVACREMEDWTVIADTS
ncbi:MAG: hypothetical protein ACTSU3_02680 [Candidatus Thorarchaeota archaeon]